ncbi:hypothetical protein PMIN06_003097 [Paraphaeosphaeria minitans]
MHPKLSKKLQYIPAIEAALKSCGAGSTLIIPDLYDPQHAQLHRFSNCDFQNKSTLKALDDTAFCNGVTFIISMCGISGAKINSVTSTSVIDWNGQTSYANFSTISSYNLQAAEVVEYHGENRRILR